MIQPLADEQQWQVTAYLTALSPQLQRSTQQLTDQQASQEAARQAARELADPAAAEGPYDAEQAQTLVATKCAQCHEPTLVADSPPESAEAARDLVARMVGEGMEATADELALIVECLQRTYVKQ